MYQTIESANVSGVNMVMIAAKLGQSINQRNPAIRRYKVRASHTPAYAQQHRGPKRV